MLTQALVCGLSNKSIIRVLYNMGIMIMIAVFLAILMPIPVLFLDFLISINIVLSVLFLFLVYKTKDFKELSSVPNMMTVIIFLNLLTIAFITRFILTIGQDFNGILIGFIAWVVSFQDFISLMIFSVMFAACIVLQNIFIYKKTNRIIKNMSGLSLNSRTEKLTAIENECVSRIISEEEAAKKKNNIHDKADFINSLESAARYFSKNERVKIIILPVNVIIGFVLGTRFRGEEASEAIIAYGSLVIASGILLMIPVIILSYGMRKAALTHSLAE